ncbi:NADH-quinone oxidoreductase subunit NuoG [Inmirania thermothiophila]|uniref:NADH-quinone oxidoreductase n=1 Tax=Inmirania thermothiophila TaxID=1750597 RepID=A0A3N1Y4R4_9GAMM|nr:NADH-quinone oxidoreductase subunit NuoG [Inmirania thermothiophila]ROR32277.1 NADH dehydrogenase subunit G [Inmirania thermothiophila]
MATSPEQRPADRVEIEIDGRRIEAPRGAMLIQAADAAGIVIPRFCYHKKLSVAANCRMCLVEVERMPKPVPACATPITDGMKVHTRSPKAIAAQRAVLEFLLINHPLDCPICDQGGECELQDLSMGYGLDDSRYDLPKRVVPDPDLGSLIATEMTRCIHCTRCVRFGEEIAGVRELGATGRGEHTRIGTYVARAVASELSGNVIDLCPVGALTSKPFRFRARPWELVEHDAVAPHDCIGSNLHVHSRRGVVLRVVPRENEAINECWLSDRDRFSYEGVHSPDRLTEPMVKEDGVWRRAGWEEALERAARALRGTVEAHGGDALGVLVSPTATLEELYLAQRLARGLGCGNVDHRLRQLDFSCDGDDPEAPLLGMGVADLERLEAALLVGSWVRKEQPIAGLRLRKAALAGARIAVLNPLDFEFHFPLAHRLVADPAGMVRRLAAVAAAACEAAGREPPAGLAGLLGGAAPGEAERAVAAALAAAGRALVVLGPLAFMHPDFGLLRMLAAVVAEATGATLGFLPEGGNGVGAWIAGAVPHRGPRGAILAAPGRNARAMLAEPRRGYLLLGVEPTRDCADPALAAAALEAAEHVVALTAFRCPDLERLADVMLPIAPYTETAGTYVNAEGRWQGFAGCVPPKGEARPGWKVLRVLGTLCDLEGFELDSAEAVRAALEAERAAGEARPVAWRAERAARPAEAELWRVADVPPYAGDPLVRRAAALQATPDGRREAAAVMAPAQAQALGLAEGEVVAVEQGGAQARLKVAVDERVPAGCVWIPTALEAAAGLGPAFGPVRVARA